MKKIFQFNWLNFITYLVQVFLFFVLCIYLMDPKHQTRSGNPDAALGEAAGALGALIMFVFLFILFLITCIIYLAWLRKTKAKKGVLIFINTVAFLLLASQVYEAFPYLIKESKDGYFSMINGYHRNQYIVGKDDYKKINLNGYKVKLFLCSKDTNLISVRDTISESKKEKFYLLRGSSVKEVEKNKVIHLLNHLNFEEQEIFSEDSRRRPLVVITENNQNKQKFGRTFIDFDNNPFNSENLPKVTFWNELENTNNVAELKGFKQFTPIEETSKIDKNGTLYFLFWHLSNQGAAMLWNGDYTQESSLCLAIRKKGEKIAVREVNLYALPNSERAIFYDGISIENLIVSGNYFYILVDGKLYYQQIRN